MSAEAVVGAGDRLRAILAEFVRPSLLDRAVEQVLAELEPTGVSEIAAILDVRKPNVRKLLRRYSVPPSGELAVGPVYPRGAIEALKIAWEADEEARAADEKRRTTARAKRDGA